MNLKQSLSWKILLPVGAILWLVFRGGESVISSGISLIGFIMAIMGIIDLGRTLIRKRKEKQS